MTVTKRQGNILEISEIDGITKQSDRNAVCLSFAHHIGLYLVCRWSNVFEKNSLFLLV